MTTRSDTVTVPKKKLLELTDDLGEDERIEFLLEVGLLEEEVDYTVSYDLEFKVDYETTKKSTQEISEAIAEHISNFEFPGVHITCVNEGYDGVEVNQ